MAKLIHYRSKCIGCGICYEMMPALWRMSKKDGKATLINATVKRNIAVLAVNGTQIGETMAVVKACPVKIIRVCK